MIGHILDSDIFILTLCVGTYVAAAELSRRLRLRILHPVPVTIACMILFLKLSGITYERFCDATSVLGFLLNLSVVSLGYLLYEQIGYLKGHAVSILTSVTVGSTVGITSVVCIVRWLGADDAIALSIAPKSVTAPIAVAICESVGGIPSLTSVIVVATGILGSIIGPFVLRKAGITDSIARGLALGSAAHGIGTARAIEIGALEGAVSGLAIGLMGIATAVVMPVLKSWLF